MNFRWALLPNLRGSLMSNITVAQCLQRASKLESVSDSARLDIELILCHILQKNRTWLFTWPDKTLTFEQQKIFDDFFQRRKNGERRVRFGGDSNPAWRTGGF